MLAVETMKEDVPRFVAAPRNALPSRTISFLVASRLESRASAIAREYNITRMCKALCVAPYRSWLFASELVFKAVFNKFLQLTLRICTLFSHALCELLSQLPSPSSAPRALLVHANIQHLRNQVNTRNERHSRTSSLTLGIYSRHQPAFRYC